MAGALGSYALVGVLVGALLAGTVGDTIGCRKVMLAAYAWFAIGIPVTALTSAVSMFGLLRFLTRDHIMASLSINQGYRSGLAIWGRGGGTHATGIARLFRRAVWFGVQDPFVERPQGGRLRDLR